MVSEAVERDLAGMGVLGESSLAATARVLAGLLDDPRHSATSKSMCAKVLREIMDRLRELVPPVSDGDLVDELGDRRAKRLAG